MRIVLLILFTLLIFSCNSKKQDSDIGEKPPKAVADTATISVNECVTTLVDTLSISYDSYAQLLQNKDSIKISDFDKLGLSRFTLLQNNQTHFKYYIIKEFDFQRSVRVLLIAEDYDAESYIYLVTYDREGELLDHLVVYYDNAEGFAYTSSFVDMDNNIIRVRDSNIYEDPEVVIKSYRISPKGAFENINTN